MRHMLDHCITVLHQRQPAVLAGIVHSSGSAPRTSGARMLILADGTSYGSIGGGGVEGACLASARQLLAGTGIFAELDFELTARAAAESGMICGGAVRVLLQRLTEADLPVFEQLRQLYASGQRPMLLTTLPTAGRPPAFAVCGAATGQQLPLGLHTELTRKNRRAPFLVGSGSEQIFVEPLVSPGTLYLAGAGHVAQALTPLAVAVGFTVVVIDDRAEFANQERFPEARETRVVADFGHCLQDLDQDDYLVIVTRGHQHDRDVLAQSLATRAGYIGMIGSRGKRAAIYASLRDSGFSDNDLARVHCPIGLAIGADTPEEIAVSIVAQLIQVRAGAGQ